MEWTSILSGVGAGIAYALTSFAKKEDQAFDGIKFGSTLVVGALAGLGLGLLNLELETTTEFFLGCGVVPLVENIIKIVWRKLISRG